MRLFRKKSARSIALIGGKNGPTAIFQTNSPKQQDDENSLTEMQKTLQPNLRLLSDLPKYLTQQYHALPYPLSDSETEMLKVNVLLNSFPEEVGFPMPPEECSSEKELVRYAEASDLAFRRAHSYPADKLNLCFRAYLLPQMGEDGTDAIIQFELRSEHLILKNATQELAEDITLWLGVSQQDIETRSPRFQVYVHTLKGRQLGARANRNPLA